jgi:CubicO group peptidase (beta-lactamase class C family)
MKIRIGRFNIHILYPVTLLIFLIACLFYFFFFKKDQNQTQFPAPFLSVDPAWADTSMKYMSIEDKIGQVIFYNAGEVKTKGTDSLLQILSETKPGGIHFQIDSLHTYINFHNWLNKLTKINCLSSTDLFSSYSTFLNVPNLKSFYSLKNDSVLSNEIAHMSSLCQTLNISFPLFSEELHMLDDSLFKKDHFTFLSSWLREFGQKNILAALSETMFFKQDSFHYELNKSLTDSALSCLLFNSINNESSNEFSFSSSLRSAYNFGGIKLYKIKDSDLNEERCKQLLEQDVEMFLTEKPKELFSLLSNYFNENDDHIDKLNLSVRKILLAKSWAGIDKDIELNEDSVLFEMNQLQHVLADRAFRKNSITLLRDDKNTIPYKNLQGRSITLLEIGKKNLAVFSETLNQYFPIRSVFINSESDDRIRKAKKLDFRSDLIISLNNVQLDTVLLNVLLNNKKFKSVSVVNFGNTENLVLLDSIPCVFQVYSTHETDQKYAADAVFGGIEVNGKLAVNLSDSLRYGMFVHKNKVRVSHALPEETGLNSEILSQIDSIAKDGIRRGAFPGCQVVVFKNGYSIHDKTYGFHTYSKQRRVRKSDLYDLASVTKIAATTLAAMRLYDKGRLRLSDNLGKFFKDKSIDYSNIKPDTIFNIDTLFFKDITDYRKILRHQDTLHLNDSMFVAYDSLIVTATPKNNIFKVQIRDILLHQSGITPTLPILPYLLYKKNYYDSLDVIKKRFYEELKKDTINFNPNTQFDVRAGLQEIFNAYFTRQYIKDSAEVKIAGGFYFQNRYFDTLWRDTKRLRVYSRKIYQYSDINMILLQQAIDSINRRGMDKYLAYNVYGPMGLRTMCYKPWKNFSNTSIVPTENDKYWREQILRGYVHDPSAAMLGGVSGNAGLFSNAYDLAVLGQMWLNNGSYGGVQYISASTVKKFTGFQEGSHRGLGFDKPARKTIIGDGAPRESYGHTGFTGTCIWVDPVHEIVYVFLSNRVHPNQKNWRINRLRVRQKIHTIVYNAMKAD